MAKRNIKTVVIHKHIHCGFASFQTGDEFLGMATTSKELDFKPVDDMIITSKKFPMLNGEKINEVIGDKEYIGIYLEAEKTFYNKGLHERRIGDSSFAKTPEFKKLVQDYLDKGFQKDLDNPEEEAYSQRQKLKRQEFDKKKGIVLWMAYDDYKKNPDVYQGGFSDDVFKSTGLYDYVKSGCAHGWIGHSGARTVALDKHIEKGLRRRGVSPSKMNNWITSGDGRHFGDSLEGYSQKEQKKRINSRLNEMYNMCLTYAVPSHGGMLTDSNRIREAIGTLGLLLPSGKTYNRKNHLKALIAAKNKLSKIKELDKDEEYLNDVITEIFSNQV